MVEELNSGVPRTNPDSGRVEDLNQGPPDFKSSALNHSATLPPSKDFFIENDKKISVNLCIGGQAKTSKV